MLDIFIFAIIAGFILTRLFKTLGRVEEGEDNSTQAMIHRFKKRERETETSEYPDIEIASAFEASLPPTVRSIFDEARSINNAFNAEQFVMGAKRAFEIIVKAFTTNDKKTLKSLLSSSVFERFSKVIDQRIDSKELHENTIVRIKDAEILDANLNNNILSITVKFTSEQINVVKDHLGNVLRGDGAKMGVVEDIWVFAKHLKTNSKVWELVETKNT
jgi:predicted lipid-binding transport protein (Tim44 family)